MFLEPGEDLAIRGIDDTVSKAEGRLKSECGAFNVEAGTFAQFAGEAGVNAARGVGPPWQVRQAQGIREVGFPLLHALEVVGDSEVFCDVALPGGTAPR